MPIELQIIRASEFLRLGPTGHLDLESSKELLKLLARACRKRGLDRAVLDLRALPVPAKRLFTPAELSTLVDTFREAGFTRQQRLAVLYKSDPHQGARLFAFISMMRGWQVRAFTDFEDALFWLSEITKRGEIRSSREIPIPITKVEPRRRITGVNRIR